MIHVDRLKALTSARGMSQAELARRVGMSQQSLWKVFEGRTRSSRYLYEIARELGTSPQYLTGDAESPDAETTLPDLTYEQRQLLACFDVLDATDRQLLLAMAMRMADRGGPNRIQNPRLEYGAQP